MKRFFVILIVAGYYTIFGTMLHSEIEQRDTILAKLEELKNIKKVLITGRAKVIFNSASANGDSFINYEKTRDYNQLIQLDLNFLAHPLEILKLGTTLRFENDISGFFGTGDMLDIRELYGEILLLRFIKIRIGTLYEKFTPFTLWAPVKLVPLDAPLFSLHKDIALYDNYLDKAEAFPLEGLSINSAFKAGEIRMDITGLATKLDDNTTVGNSFDRYLFGANGKIVYNKIAAFALNWVSIQDLKNTGSPVYNNPLRSDVVSGEATIDFAPILFTPKFNINSFGVEGELALSSFKSNINIDSTVKGVANRIKLFLKYNNMLNLEAGWRGIEYEFVSPGAQTRVSTPGGEGDFFEDLVGLPPFLTDYYYRNKIMVSRDNLDFLNFTYPMNIATPNRTGIFGNIGIDYKTFVHTKFELSSMQEVRPVSTPNRNKRSFFRNEGEVSINIPTIVGIDYLPEVGGFYILEHSKREDWLATAGTNLNEKEDCKVTVLGVNIMLQLVDKLSVIGMYQNYKIKGPKVVDSYYTHQPIIIAGYLPDENGNTTYNFDIENVVVGAGLIYELTKVSKIQLDYLNKEYVNNYTINNVRLLFVTKF